jgi:hypothetical protein
MASYTLHVAAEAQPGDAQALRGAVVVKDGFSWGALLFQPLWLLWHRLWHGAALWLVAMLVVGGLCFWLQSGAAATVLAFAALALLFANEANAVRTWTLRRCGLPVRDAVLADDLPEAEAKAFSRWLASSSQAAAAGAAPAPGAAGPAGDRSAAIKSAGILGLFPEPEPGQ